MYKYVKRFLDIVLSLAALVVLMPLMLVIAVVIKIDSPGPVLFVQDRITKGKKIFKILKFRTMFTDVPKDVPTHLLGDPESKITKVGKFLRKSSLDELPQIWNILVGEMSIIGPRPALYNQYDLIAERDKYGANDIRPGLTGLAQIMGRDELPIEVKARYDGEYTQNISFANDIRIFFRTITSVLSASGVKEGKQ
ncbi:MAG: sugar transferase [Oscillospiraceae bacterium]|nr:sugar transferase [Oscillospiraceae bacterium]